MPAPLSPAPPETTRAPGATPAPPRAPGGEAWVALLGNPNTGKSTLFNALTGGRARVGNYPGVTVDKKVGRLRPPRGGTPAGDGAPSIRLLDLPGTYSLAARTPDEIVAVDVLLARRADVAPPAAAVVVVDAANLERNLYLATQVIEVGLPVVIALNMVDQARGRGIRVDADALARGLGVVVVPTVASRREGIEDLARAIREAVDGAPAPVRWTWPEGLLAAERDVGERLRVVGVAPDLPAVERRRALLDAGGETEARLVRRHGEAARRALEAARQGAERAGVALAGVEAGVRYGFIADLASTCLVRPDASPTTFSDRLDAVLTHRLWGALAFVGVMGLVFLSIFAWATPLMDLVDGAFGALAGALEGNLGAGAVESLVVNGIVGGVGSVLIFLPQILVLFLFLGVLEGCGYMARAAFLMDRLLRWCGLSGRSFIPMLSSFACAVPGIMAARSIDGRRDRIATILVAPLMSCSARIPVYVLMTAAFVPAIPLLGFLNLQGVVFASMYFLGILVAIPVAWILKRTLLRGEGAPFLVELPPYRAPRPGVVLRRTVEQGQAFLLRAGSLILAASIVVWALSYWPRHPDPQGAVADEVARETAPLDDEVRALVTEDARQRQWVELAEATQPGEISRVAREAYEAYVAMKDGRLAAIDDEREQALAHAAAGEALRHSFLGRMGRFVEPAFAPIGWDWKVSAAVIASFPAREVVVSTMGVIYNMGEEADEESEGLRAKLVAARWEAGPRAGRPVFDLASAIALMVFFALCAQCVSTLVTIRKEAGGWRWAAVAFVYMTALAWVGALATATLLRAVA